MTDTFEYTVTDDNGASSTATVTITINGENDAPIAASVTGSVGEDGPGTVVSASFTDVDDSDTHTFAVDTTGTLGSVTDNGDGTFSYDPNGAFESLAAGESVTDTFEYTVTDDNGASSTATVTITINGENDIATVTDDVGDVAEDGILTVTGLVVVSDVDSGEDMAVPQAGTAGTYGTFVVDAAGNWSYTLDNSSAAVQSLADGEVVTDTFTVASFDGTGTGTVTITITGENDAAIITGDISGTAVEEGLSVTPGSDATGNLDHTDVDNDDDSWTAGSQTGSYGTFGIDAAGEWTYSIDNSNPAVDALNDGDTLSESFTVTTDDGTTETVTITIEGSNDDPVIIAVNSTGGVTEDFSVASGSNLLSDSGDILLTDVDSGGFSAVVAPVSGGTPLGNVTTLVSGGTVDWVYEVNNDDVQFLAEGETIIESFIITISDGDGGSVDQLIEITITGQNDDPVANDDTAVISEDAGATVIDILGNDTDVDTMDVLEVINIDTTGLAGTATLTGGVVSYSPDGQFEALNDGQAATETFTYTISDGNGGTSTATVTVTIEGINDAAIISGDTSGTAVETGLAPGSNATGDLDHTDVDNDDDVWTPSTQTGTYGSLTIDADGLWTYIVDDANPVVDALNAGESLTDMVTVTTEDGTEQVITITIEGANDEPTSVPTVREILVNSTLWNPGFRDYVDGVNIGDVNDGLARGYSVPFGTNQLQTLPWNNINELQVVFSEDVSGVDTGDFSFVSDLTYLTGDGAGTPGLLPTIDSVTYDASTFTATISFAPGQFFQANVFDFVIDSAGIQNIAGSNLDGEWTTQSGAFESGDGTAGGDFVFRVLTLPGDADDAAIGTSFEEVNAGDADAIRILQNEVSIDAGGFTVTTPGFDPRSDLNGDGEINGGDADFVRVEQNAFLVALSAFAPFGSSNDSSLSQDSEETNSRILRSTTEISTNLSGAIEVDAKGVALDSIFDESSEDETTKKEAVSERDAFFAKLSKN